MTLGKTQDIYFNNYDVEFIKEADKQGKLSFLNMDIILKEMKNYNKIK